MVLVFQLRVDSKLDFPAVFFFGGGEGGTEVAQRWGPLPAGQPCISLCVCAHAARLLKEINQQYLKWLQSECPRFGRGGRQVAEKDT